MTPLVAMIPCLTERRDRGGRSQGLNDAIYKIMNMLLLQLVQLDEDEVA